MLRKILVVPTPSFHVHRICNKHFVTANSRKLYDKLAGYWILPCNVTRDTDNLPDDIGACVYSLLIAKHASDRRRGVMTLSLIFDLLNSTQGHGSSVSLASFLTIVSWLRPSCLDLGSSM